VWRDGKSWSQQHELAAVAIERTEMWSSVLAQLLAHLGGSKTDRLPKLIEIAHPDRTVPRAPKPVTDPEQISRFFAGLRG
jgi:hypothetical protein